MFIKNVNVALRFFLELCAMASLGYWGFKCTNDMSIKLVLGIGAPLLTAILWGMFGAPHAPYQLSKSVRWFLIIGIYFIAGFSSICFRKAVSCSFIRFNCYNE